MKKALFISSLLLFAGCVGSPVHSHVTYRSRKKTIRKNTTGLMKLKAGMTQEEVRNVMGRPVRSEGYPWGSVWLYRTAISSGIYRTVDSDLTPVMFDKNKILHGWGRNYFEQYVNKYELTIKNEP